MVKTNLLQVPSKLMPRGPRNPSILNARTAFSTDRILLAKPYVRENYWCTRRTAEEGVIRTHMIYTDCRIRHSVVFQHDHQRAVWRSGQTYTEARFCGRCFGYSVNRSFLLRLPSTRRSTVSARLWCRSHRSRGLRTISGVEVAATKIQYFDPVEPAGRKAA